MCRPVKALEGTIPTDASDSWFAYIATIDDGDDWTDPAVVEQANPSLGVTVKSEDLKRQVDEAREMPAQQTRSGGCASTNGPSRSPAGSTWRSGARAVRRP